MQYTTLGNTDVKVSKICLGTMTFGEQNTEAEAHEQLDYALAQGVNFIDTAEMYAVPARPETYGRTEEYIGTWIASRKNRDKFVLATKIVGYAPGLQYVRGGSHFNKEQLNEALNNSLKRLQTDYVDLYQLHWPERKTNFFGQLGYKHDPNDPWEDNILQILETLAGFVKEGKIKHIGISNETPWATMRFAYLADKHNLPRIVSVQNPYNLLNRTYEIGLAEVSIREKIGLLAYSPLGFGLLSGKYFTDPAAKGRINMFPKLARYNGQISNQAAREYAELAKEHGLSPAQMALAYVNTRDFLTSNIIGATSMAQLKENIASVDVVLSPEVLQGIEAIHQSKPNPAP